MCDEDPDYLRPYYPRVRFIAYLGSTCSSKSRCTTAHPHAANLLVAPQRPIHCHVCLLSTAQLLLTISTCGFHHYFLYVLTCSHPLLQNHVVPVIPFPLPYHCAHSIKVGICPSYDTCNTTTSLALHACLSIPLAQAKCAPSNSDAFLVDQLLPLAGSVLEHDLSVLIWAPICKNQIFFFPIRKCHILSTEMYKS